MTTVAIMQPTYLGWCGYFDMLDQADVFVLLDTVPVSPKSWQTRNRIRARDGNVVWLSVPTNAKRGMPLDEVRIDNTQTWQAKHWRTFESAYSHAPYWRAFPDDVVGQLFLMEPETLTNLNEGFILTLGWTYLGIKAARHGLVRASTLGPGARADDPFERIAYICEQVGAQELLNTPGAKDWLQGHDVGVPVRWHDYEHPVYSQGDAPFMSHLSVVDLLAWHGPDALDIIRSGRR